ncbi:alpha-1,2-mannosyltransferase [Amycolatopsis sacchari]|uniref:Alpha-1,2-mannosyltransferase n=1 Tax=Amycolatopsis sacchari TaxID=115433 RepID=A0A1I4B1F3_9PSEU|nr:glycosyltransferase 87 family protein [Amycolatopsis sacchari]SFK62200.1 alpha-1,2-mannosyltransferase [Amycolatopsis sacchari]
MLGRKTLAVLCAAELVLIAIVLLWKRLDGLDLDVYRLGAQAFFTHGDPYGVLPPTRDGTRLPFTYPPFAALVFAPLLTVPPQVALIALTVVSVVALGAVLALCLGRFGPLVLVAQAVALFSEPVRATLGFGQVNILLMLLVAVDVLAFRRRGYLVGLAAAVKLTPLAFVLFFFVRRDFRASARALGTFAGCAVLTWLIAPDASEEYWTSLVFQGDRIGDPGYIGNQSLRGLLARLDLGQGWWLLAAVLVLAATAYAIRRARDEVPALLVCAVGALLVSPVSWTHHWVWVAPAIALLYAKRRWWAAVPLTIVFVVSPVWDFSFWPLRESYVLAGLLLALALHDVLDARRQRGDVVRLDRGEHADA